MSGSLHYVGHVSQVVTLFGPTKQLVTEIQAHFFPFALDLEQRKENVSKDMSYAAKIHQDPLKNHSSTRTWVHTLPDSQPSFEKPRKPSKYVKKDETASMLQRQPKPLDEIQVRELMMQGFTKGECNQTWILPKLYPCCANQAWIFPLGLSLSLNPLREVFALRIWIIDNSGSHASKRWTQN
jgi:hypothetical protein